MLATASLLTIVAVWGGPDEVKIQILIGETVLSGHLLNTPAARDLAAMLPLELDLADYAGTEKIADLSAGLNRAAAPDGYAATAGDITWYAPWGNLAIFYRDFPYSRGLVPLGALDSGLDVIQKPGSLKAVIRRLDDSGDSE